MRVSAVQKAPAYLDRSTTIEIVVNSILEAAGQGSELVAFPKTFVLGYPVWATTPTRRTSTTRFSRRRMPSTSMPPWTGAR